MKIVKYSKSYKNIIKLQKNYLKENLNNLKNELRIKQIHSILESCLMK